MVVEHQTIKKLLEHLELTLSKIENMEFSSTELLKDVDTQDVLDRRLQIAIETCIDIASHMAAELSLSNRDTAADVFIALGQSEVIPEKLARKFKPIVGLRNVLVHRYAEINHKTIFEDYKKDIEDIREFARVVTAFLERNPNL